MARIFILIIIIFGGFGGYRFYLKYKNRLHRMTQRYLITTACVDGYLPKFIQASRIDPNLKAKNKNMAHFVNQMKLMGEIEKKSAAEKGKEKDWKKVRGFFVSLAEGKSPIKADHTRHWALAIHKKCGRRLKVSRRQSLEFVTSFVYYYGLRSTIASSG